jgi:hypothetical protein
MSTDAQRHTATVHRMPRHTPSSDVSSMIDRMPTLPMSVPAPRHTRTSKQSDDMAGSSRRNVGFVFGPGLHDTCGLALVAVAEGDGVMQITSPNLRLAFL